MKERGFFESTFVVFLLGISIAVWLISVVLGWVYETKEHRAAQRQLQTKKQLAIHLTKEQIIKYGVGEFEATCSGLFVKNCAINDS